MVIKLPSFKGYTFDFRTEQIRRIRCDKPFEFIDMYSPEGKALLVAFFNDEQAVDEFYDYLDSHKWSGYDVSWWHRQQPRIQTIRNKQAKDNDI